MYLDTKKITELCIKHEISVRDFFFLYCLVTEDIDSLESYIQQSVDKWLTTDDFNNLHRKGLIDFAGVEGKDYTKVNVPTDIIIVAPFFRKDIIQRKLFS